MGLHHSGPNFVRTLVIPVFIQDRSAEEDPDPTPGRIKSPRGSRQTVCRALCGLAQQVGDTGQVGRSTAPVPPAAPRQQVGDTGQVGRSTAPGRRWHLANRSGTLGKLAGQLQDRSAEEDPDPTRAASSRAAGSAEQCAGHCAGRRRPRTVSHWKHPVTRGPSDNLHYIGYHTRSRRPGGPGTLSRVRKAHGSNAQARACGASGSVPRFTGPHCSRKTKTQPQPISNASTEQLSNGGSPGLQITHPAGKTHNAGFPADYTTTRGPTAAPSKSR